MVRTAHPTIAAPTVFGTTTPTGEKAITPIPTDATTTHVSTVTTTATIDGVDNADQTEAPTITEMKESSEITTIVTAGGSINDTITTLIGATESPSNGEGLDEQDVDNNDEVATDVQLLTMTVPSTPVHVIPTAEQLFQLSIDPLQRPTMVVCTLKGDFGDPDFEILQNNVNGALLCTDRSSGPRGSCRIPVSAYTTNLIIKVSAWSGMIAENVVVLCQSYAEEVTLGTPSSPVKLESAGDTVWLLLNMEERVPATRFQCSRSGINNSTDGTNLTVHRDIQSNDDLCQSFQDKSGCLSNTARDANMYWIGIVSPVNDVTVTVRCEAVYGDAQTLPLDVTSPPFTLDAGQNLTFATEIGPGEAAFCWMTEETGTVLNHTDLELVLGVNTPPDLLSGDNHYNYCHSDNFFTDDDVCFAYGSTTERSVIYTTVQSDQGASGLLLTCDKAKEINRGYVSAKFNVSKNNFQSFFVPVPSTVDRLFCSSFADNGDIDLYGKIFKTSFSTYEFDCLSTSDVSVEGCDIAIPPTTTDSTNLIFFIVYGFRETTDVVFSCVAPLQPDGDIEVGRDGGSSGMPNGNPDLP